MAVCQRAGLAVQMLNTQMHVINVLGTNDVSAARQLRWAVFCDFVYVLYISAPQIADRM